MEHRDAGRIDADALRHRLPITQAEAAVLARLMEGETLRSIASQRDLALETVRSYVKSLLRKTSCHSQVQLVSFAWRIIAAGHDADAGIKTPEPD